jgi:superfamily I DNA/RNA helicase
MRNDKMPKLEEVLKMGQGETDAYTVFCDNILSQVVGRNVWKRDSPKTDVSELATVSDEAFAILLLENSYDLWSQMARQKEAEKAKKEFTEQAKIAKYTLNGAGIKKNKGWRKEGLERFNQIVKDVLKDRETGGREGFEEEYREGKKQMEEEKNGKKKKKKSSEQEKEVEFEVYMDIHQPKKKKKDSEATNAESEYSKVEVHEM